MTAREQCEALLVTGTRRGRLGERCSASGSRYWEHDGRVLCWVHLQAAKDSRHLFFGVVCPASAEARKRRNLNHEDQQQKSGDQFR